MPLDKPAAEAAIDRLARQARAPAARRPPRGIYRIVAETMAGAARAHATDRGVDHRGLPLLAFGGAGPVHACAVGELLQSTAVIFPPQASVLSAFGSLVTPVRLDLVRSALGPLDELDWDEVDRAARRDDRRSGWRRWPRPAAAPAEMPLQLRRRPALFRPAERGRRSPSTDDPARRPRRRRRSARTFEAAYFAQYGVNPSHVPIEVVSWRLTAQRAGDQRRQTPAAPAGAPAAAQGASAPIAAVGRTRPRAGLRPRQPGRRARRMRRPGDHRGARDDDRAAAGLGRRGRRRSAASSREAEGRLSMDGIELEILWSNLIGIVSEQAKALQRIAFSPIVREAGDLASGLFDARGRMVAQANTGTPGHINSLAAAGADPGQAVRGQAGPRRHRHHQRSVDVGRALLRHHRASARCSGTSG